jgi:hypothetical protein
MKASTREMGVKLSKTYILSCGTRCGSLGPPSLGFGRFIA